MSSERRVSRREVLAATATGLVGGVGVAGQVSANDDDGWPDEEVPRYVVRQGLLRFPLEPVNHGDQDVREFYGYNDENRHSSNFSRDLTERKHVSRLFVYDGPMNPSLVLHHGHPNGDHGGRAHLEFSGLDEDRGEWVVRDDPPRIDEDFATGEQNRVHWRWGENRTDGGAWWGDFEEDFEIEIFPREFSSGVYSWWALSQLGRHRGRGRGGGGVRIDRYRLDMEKPVSLTPGRRPIRQADIDVIPGEEPTFDPYQEEGRIRVEIADVEDSSAARLSEDLYFGSQSALAEGDGAQPQSMTFRGNRVYATFSIGEAGFSIGDTQGYLVGPTRDGERVVGSAPVRPGGFEPKN